MITKCFCVFVSKLNGMKLCKLSKFRYLDTNLGPSKKTNKKAAHFLNMRLSVTILLRKLEKSHSASFRNHYSK